MCNDGPSNHAHACVTTWTSQQVSMIHQERIRATRERLLGPVAAMMVEVTPHRCVVAWGLTVVPWW